MCVLFNDPDVDLDDIHWYNTLMLRMMDSVDKNEGLIVFNAEKDTHSCYVELQRKG